MRPGRCLKSLANSTARKKRGVRLLGLPPKLRPPASLPGSCFPYQGVYTEKVVVALTVVDPEVARAVSL